MVTFQKKTNLFYKYIASYAAVLLLPVIVMGIIIYTYFLGVFEDDILANNMNNLNKTKNIVDSQLLELKNISDQLHLDYNLNAFNFDSAPLQALTIINELNKYKLTNSFFLDVILYYRGEAFLYTSTSSNRVDLFSKNIYNYKNWDSETFYKDINSIILPSIRPTEEVKIYTGNQNLFERIVTFIYPLSYDGFHANKTAIFLVTENSFNNLIKSSIENYNGNTIIFDNNNNIITSLEDKDYLYSENFKELLASREDTSSQNIMLNNKEYLFAFSRSEATGWKYVTLVPTDSIFSKVASAKLIFLFTFLVILFIGGTIIAFLMNINYKPIQKLSQLSEKLLNIGKKPTDELDTVRSAIEYLNTQNTKLHVELHSNEYAIKEYLLFRLLNGHISAAEDINKNGELIGIKFTKPTFRVINFHIKSFKSLAKFDSIDITNMIESNLPDEIEGLVRDNSDNDQFALILATDNIADSVIENTLIKIHSILKSKLGLPVTIGIGNAYDSISEVPKSFMEAATAVNYRLVKGIDRLIHINEIAAGSSKFDIAISHAPEKLKTFIKQGNTEQIENLLTNILSYLKQNSIPIFSARMICYDIINTVTKTVNEFCKDNLIPLIEHPDVFLLSEFETVDDLVHIVRKLSDDICKYLKETNARPPMSTTDQMVTYLKNNYTDCDFSVQQMADHFNLALPNLSTYFKENTGHNILDYVTSLKIEKAKNLLLTSNIPLKDIGMEVGYYNVTSFIRRFKQVVGETPGEYRKKAVKDVH